MSIIEDFDSKPKPQEVSPAGKKWPIDVEKLSPAERAEIVERINAIKAREKEEVDLQTQLDAKIARNDRFIDNNIAIEKHMAALQQSEELQETQQAPAVPLATAAGGNMQPPNDFAKEKIQGTQDELVPKAAIDALTEQLQQEREAREKQALIDRVGLASVEHAVIARTPMDPNGIIDTEGKLAYRSDLINQFGVEAVRQEFEGKPEAPTTLATAPQPPDPSLVAPQTREHTDARAIEEMSGVGSNWADAGHLAKKIGTAAFEKAADWYPYSVLGRFSAKMGRFATRIITAPKREILWSLHNMRSELAAKANQKVEGYKNEVKKLEGDLAVKDKQISESAQKINSGGIKGLFTPNVAAKLDRERRAMVDKIEKVKAKQNKAYVKLTTQQHKEEYWSNRQSALAETIVNGIEKDLVPARAEFVALTARKDEVANKLEDLKRAREMGHQGLIDIEARLKSNPSLIDNVALHETRDGVQAMLERMDGIYADLSKKQSAIESKMAQINHFIGEAVEAQAGELNQTTKDRLRYDQGPQQRGELARVEHDFEHAPKPAGQ
jgi:hypothetical protein